MTGMLAVDDLLAVLDAESTLLAEEAGRVLMSDPVPTCPDWTVGELLEHIGGVHRWAAAIVTGGLLRNLPAEQEAAVIGRPPQNGLVPWFRAGAEQILQALIAAPDELHAFVFLKNAPPPRHFWARRQAHETTIHRVDALAARLGRMPSTAEAGIETAVAVDGIDELVRGFVPRRSSRLHTDEPFTMAIAPTDAAAGWTIAVSGEPPSVSLGVDQDANAVLSGSAAALYLGLWNRGDDVAENGTVDALGHWRDQVRVSWS